MKICLFFCICLSSLALSLSLSLSSSRRCPSSVADVSSGCCLVRLAASEPLERAARLSYVSPHPNPRRRFHLWPRCFAPSCVSVREPLLTRNRPKVSEKLHMADEFKLEHNGRSLLRSGRTATLDSLGLKYGAARRRRSTAAAARIHPCSTLPPRPGAGTCCSSYGAPSSVGSRPSAKRCAQPGSIARAPQPPLCLTLPAYLTAWTGRGRQNSDQAGREGAAQSRCALVRCRPRCRQGPCERARDVRLTSLPSFPPPFRPAASTGTKGDASTAHRSSPTTSRCSTPRTRPSSSSPSSPTSASSTAAPTTGASPN